MATRIVDHTIPDEFIRLDSRITFADAFVNVRDMQVARSNHNILVARGVKRHLVTYIGAPGNSTYFYSCSPASRDVGDVLMNFTLRLTPQTRELVVVMTGRRRSVDADCKIYYGLDGAGESGEIDTTNFMDVTSVVAGTRYTMTMNVKEAAARIGQCSVNFYLDGTTYGNDLMGASCGITDAGSDWVDVDTNIAGISVPTGSAIYLDNSPGKQEPLLVTGGLTTGALTSKLFLDRPFTVTPHPLVDTFEARAAAGVQIDSLTIYEAGNSSFATQVEVI